MTVNATATAIAAAAVAILLGATVTPGGAAAADDALRITADEAEVDLRAGRRVYQGNVVVRHRGLRIDAARLDMVYAGDDLSTATAAGDPARFRHRAEGSGSAPEVHGAGATIQLNQAARTVTMSGAAVIRRGGDETRGDTIIYHLDRGTMTVHGASATVQP
ncbi:MAG: lipopolysaccharide transport periplasmic protein LptA [Gammaproteobacteria bacterium]|nr:lipopolysaccharide transport periplasmic protein LptA [Gammaproteobacteria bacterium]